MFQQIILGLGYLSALMTGINGILAVIGKKDSKVGHVTAAIGTDVQKLYGAFAGKP